VEDPLRVLVRLEKRARWVGGVAHRPRLVSDSQRGSPCQAPPVRHAICVQCMYLAGTAVVGGDEVGYTCVPVADGRAYKARVCLQVDTVHSTQYIRVRRDS
jgi:hypothetical protein